MDKTSSMYIYVRLKGDANCFLPVQNKDCINSASYVYECMTNNIWCSWTADYVVLPQTNVGNNNNKYYLIQLLEEDAKKSYHVWQRWGRVGYGGQNNLVPCGPNLDQAKKVFMKK